MRGIHLFFLLVMLMVLGTIWYEISQRKFAGQENSVLSQNQTQHKNLTVCNQNTVAQLEQQNESLSRVEIQVIAQNGSHHTFSPTLDKLSYSLDIEGLTLQMDLGDEKVVMRIYERWWITDGDLENFLARLNISEDSLKFLRDYLIFLNSSGWILSRPPPPEIEYADVSFEAYRNLVKNLSGIDINLPKILPNRMVLTTVKMITRYEGSDWRSFPQFKPLFPPAVAIYSRKNTTTFREADITVDIWVWGGISTSDIILYTKEAMEGDMRGEINQRILEGSKAVEVKNNLTEVFPIMKEYLKKYRSVTFVNRSLVLNINKKVFFGPEFDPLNRPGRMAWIVREHDGTPIAYMICGKYDITIDYFVEIVRLIVSS
ncbi:MAG: hypothetical protein ACP5KE_07905 [Candidatus Methanodesulfokora sp.]